MFDLVPFSHAADGLFHEFDRMINDGFWGGLDTCQSFRTDILDKGDKYVMRADLPGFQKQEINIDVEGNLLTLSAEHKEEINENNKNYVRRERRYGALKRSFDISDIDADKISASYNNGVLEVELPKLVPTKAPQKKIEVK